MFIDLNLIIFVNTPILKPEKDHKGIKDHYHNPINPIIERISHHPIISHSTQDILPKNGK